MKELINLFGISLILRLAKRLDSETFKPAICILPWENDSTVEADGNCKMRNISRAAAKSGFIIMEMPSSSRIKFICAEYSGFLTRAIVCFAPIFLAIRQDKIFFSSEGVVQISKSQFFISASSNTL